MNLLQLMKVRSFTRQFRYLIFSLVLLTLRAMAQDVHSHALASQQALLPEQKQKQSELIRIVRESTERFKDVAEAGRAGYVLQFGCVSGPDSGAMGLHFVNGPLVNAGVLDPRHPQIVIYEPTADGKLRLIGADFLLLADAWNAKHEGPPELMGQLSTSSTAPIVSDIRRSTRCMSGRGRTIRTVRS